jgi:predicted restriction endonuclease
VDVYERIQGAIEKVRTENKGPGKESQNWTLYRVLDWDLLAAVGLAGESVGGDLKNDLTTILSDEVASSTEKESLISARLGQGAFRTNVLAIWGNRCSVTGSSTLEVIRASHIKPWRDSNNSERLDPYNGLPLVASLDALFDAGIISFDEKGNILVSSILDKKEQDIYGVVGKVLTKEPSKNTASYLQYHRANIYRG